VWSSERGKEFGRAGVWEWEEGREGGIEGGREGGDEGEKEIERLSSNAGLSAGGSEVWEGSVGGRERQSVAAWVCRRWRGGVVIF